MKSFFQIMLVGCSLFLLSGCGGGGGGGSGSGGDSALNNFIKWSAIAPPETVKVEGISQESSYTAPSSVVTSVTNHPVHTSSSVTIKYASDGAIVRFTINTPYTNMTWDQENGDDIFSEFGVMAAIDQSGSNFALVVDATDPSIYWEYQSFGIWQTGRGTVSGTVGGMSVGAPTTGSAIPVSGDATFTGLAFGTYLDKEGWNDYSVVAELEVGVDFFKRQMDFNTSETEIIHNTYGWDKPAPNLNMTGTLTYASGTNSFTGAVTATGLSGTGLSGTTTGRFYGPVAEELGGVFNLTGSGVETFGGAYGAAR